MDEHEEVTFRRWRFNLMAAVQRIAEARNVGDLHNTELIPSFYDCIDEDGLAYGDSAMTEDERSSVLELFAALNAICDEAVAVKRRGRLGSPSHGVKPEDLVLLGWFENVQPLARKAFNRLLAHGWMAEGR